MKTLIINLIILTTFTACSTMQQRWPAQWFNTKQTLQLIQQIQIIDEGKPAKQIQAAIEIHEDSQQVVFLSNTGRRIGSYNYIPSNKLLKITASTYLPRSTLTRVVEAIHLSMLTLENWKMINQANIQQTKHWHIADDTSQRTVYYQSQEYAEIVYTSEPREQGQLIYKNIHTDMTLIIQSTSL